MQMEVEKIEMLINLVVRNVYGRLCAEGRFVQGFTVSVPIPGYADELETYAATPYSMNASVKWK